jgi:hypothetical protein
MLLDLKICPTSLDNIPDIGDVFNYNMQGNHVRTMRIPSKKATVKNHLRLFVIDSGEEFDCNFEDYGCFQMLPYLRKAPSHSLFCHLENLESVGDKPEFLTKSLNEFVEFQIIRVDPPRTHEFQQFLDVFCVNLRSKRLDDNENLSAVNLNCPGSSKVQESYETHQNSENSSENPDTSQWRSPQFHKSDNDSKTWKTPEKCEILIDDHYKTQQVPHNKEILVNTMTMDQSSQKQQKVPEISSHATSQAPNGKSENSDEDMWLDCSGSQGSDLPRNFEDFKSDLTGENIF